MACAVIVSGLLIGCGGEADSSLDSRAGAQAIPAASAPATEEVVSFRVAGFVKAMGIT